MIYFSLFPSSFQITYFQFLLFSAYTVVAHSLVFLSVPHSLAKWNNAGNRYFLISVVKLFLKYSLCVTYVITVKSVRDIDVKPTGSINLRFLVFSCRGVWGHATPENFSSLHSIFTHLQYRWKHSVVIHDSFSHLSLFVIPKFLTRRFMIPTNFTAMIHDSASPPTVTLYGILHLRKRRRR